ncbi:potassium channel subfamily K member 15-like isoform X1 [Daphnia pulicaria]|uniref:potassium channel subfamily K member 15-like isoform X1 n=2 Tax=Daphnia pulicaria TaxID=35523 RepID=UPI001EEAA5B0|nr:potassium channel subfamily K member 15-like isoform X1 [Daphnia pulicaria]XP_046636977.1 potassium channel subfamily K member 15-like isoform X1 [Daphnia pulicaria]XP_046636978.1 potassium channel subfamily K member 15-like isoform X1 [Daphnia pulicaria]
MHSTYVKMAMDRQRAELRHRRNRRLRSAMVLKNKLKDCCRKITAFFFTQIGVCGLIVGYTIVGAFMFIALEAEAQHPLTQQVITRRRSCVDYLWNITHHLNVLNYDQWRQDVNRTVFEYQAQMVRHIRRGYDGTDENPLLMRWTIPAALMYCITIYTTIGYGNLTPRTAGGKFATVIYAMVGIPLMLLYMANVGEILATSFKFTYKKMCKCPRRRRRGQLTPEVATIPVSQEPVRDKKRKKHKTDPAATITVSVIPVEPAEEDDPTAYDPQTVSVTSCLVVMSSFVIGGAILFSVWEGWGYVDGSYFCFTSLLTIGFGDFVPGQTIAHSQDAVDSKLIICAVYLLLGMALLAMCFNLMQESVFMKIKRLGRRLGLLRDRSAAAASS